MKDATFGGYLTAHDRPPAFEGSDGRAYSADLWVAEEPEPDGRFGGAFMFIRWTPAGDAPDGHLESEYVVWGADRAEAEARLKALDLHAVKAALDAAVARVRELGDW
jgi:hypothetical protein